LHFYLKENGVPPYQYPLKLTFKIMSFSPQVSVQDAGGKEEFFVHQKALKLKEDVSVYADSSKNRELYRIQADRMMGVSIRYNFTDSISGAAFGAIRRDGMRSIFKAAYSIFAEGDQPTHHLKEDNSWVRALHLLFRDITIIGMFAGYLFNPTFTLYQSGSETPVMHLKKLPALMYHAYEITKLSEPANEAEETRLLLGLMQMTLVEHTRS
jgi:hypothetical protein